jgi:hypothetical protein
MDTAELDRMAQAEYERYVGWANSQMERPVLKPEARPRRAGWVVLLGAVAFDLFGLWLVFGWDGRL